MYALKLLFTSVDIFKVGRLGNDCSRDTDFQTFIHENIHFSIVCNSCLAHIPPLMTATWVNAFVSFCLFVGFILSKQWSFALKLRITEDLILTLAAPPKVYFQQSKFKVYIKFIDRSSWNLSKLRKQETRSTCIFLFMFIQISRFYPLNWAWTTSWFPPQSNLHLQQWWLRMNEKSKGLIRPLYY